MSYQINANYLNKIGFKKNLLLNQDDRVYVFQKHGRRFDLLFIEELELLSIERIIGNEDDYFLIDKLRIQSDEELTFIISRLPSLQSALNIAN